jgi:hypothetical protein
MAEAVTANHPPYFSTTNLALKSVVGWSVWPVSKLLAGHSVWLYAR